MEVTFEKVKAVFVKWNKDVLDDPDRFNQEEVTDSNLESYSEDQANDFIKRLTELSEKGE